MRKDLSIIVLSFNTKEVTDKCLSALKKALKYCQTRLKNKIEVIVIDNASSDGSPQLIRKRYPWVKLIALEENTGFSKGNNIGMRESKYPFILLLNSDCFVTESALYDALNYFEQNPNCGLLGAKLILPNGRVQISNGYLYNPVNIFFWIAGLPWVAPIHPRKVMDKVSEVGWVMGAFFMLRREVFEKTGGFDENIFMYGEEVEWCKRIRDKGFKIFYVPSVVAKHLDKASSKADASGPFVKEIRGVMYFTQKHYKSWYPIVNLIVKIFLVVRIVFFGLRQDEVRVRAYRSVFNNL